MEKTGKQRRLRGVAAVAAACVVVLGCTTAAYAADLGGIQRTLQLWIHGDQTEATIQFGGDGTYSMEYTDGEGKLRQQSGGGVAILPDGTEVPVSQEELLAELTSPEVSYEEDGSVWVYWFEQKVEITDKFENGICRVRLVNGEETLYMTVKYQNGYATSPRKYPNPSAFN